MGEILWVEGGAIDPKVPTLFLVADIDTGVIRWVNADCLQQIMLLFELPAEVKNPVIAMHLPFCDHHHRQS